MTNPKSRKTGTSAKSATIVQSSDQVSVGELFINSSDNTSEDRHVNELTMIAISNTEDAEDDDDDEPSSCSSFSLQECINEFRARRIRRSSAQSRDAAQQDEFGAEGSVVADKSEKKSFVDPADADLINQNRCNKEQERKCKPCRDGFCYCFTSDSGDGGVCGAKASHTRAAHVRQPRRVARRSECNERTCTLISHAHATKHEIDRRQSAPAKLKLAEEWEQEALPQKEAKGSTLGKTTASAHQLTAISRLETSTDDAPLIHIVQELRNNCVISEVRVNKQKIQEMQSGQRASTLPAKNSPQKKHISRNTRDMHLPTAPPLESFAISKQQPLKDNLHAVKTLEKISELDSRSDAFSISSSLSSTKNESSRHKRKSGGGRLLQKRLSHSTTYLKPYRTMQPPPKPPRSSKAFDVKSTVSSLSSSTPSVREAERIIDEFLLKRGVKVRNTKSVLETNRTNNTDKRTQQDNDSTKVEKQFKSREFRKSYPSHMMTKRAQKLKSLPSCPSLSEIERVPNGNRTKYRNYEKNMCRFTEKPVKELSFGWKEPKITDMLNCDTSDNRRRFKSQAVQAEPQQTIGWQMPRKIDLDTVDGAVNCNLASNIEIKNTPVKTPPVETQKDPSGAHESHKFIWSQQWRNLSPWVHNKPGTGGCSFKSSSRALFHCSKKKILRLVTPKRNNLQRRRAAAKSDLKDVAQRNVAIQTSPEELRPYEVGPTPQSPPGSYHSAVQNSTQSTTPTCSQNTNDTEIAQARNFDFSRTICSPPKKEPRSSTQRKLNFPLGCASNSCGTYERETLVKTRTYRNYQSDINQDVTISKLGYILGNIRAKLEASDEYAVRTFQEIERREQQAAGVDCPDGFIRRQPTLTQALAHQHQRQDRRRRSLMDNDCIYSEIEEDSIHVMGTPQYDNSDGLRRASNNQNIEVIYAKVNKLPKPPKSTKHAPTALGKIIHDSLRNINISAVTTLPTLPEQSSNASDTSYMSPPQFRLESDASNHSHCQSLNNVRVQEHHSPPKKDRNMLSKSDLSLHRSDIFLDNLCRGEIIVDNGELERIEKVNNRELNQSCTSNSFQSTQRSTYRRFSTSTPTPNDSISYDIPDDVHFECAISQLSLNVDDSALQTLEESTTNNSHGIPIKISDLQLGIENSAVADISPCKQSSSCPATSQIQSAKTFETVPHKTSVNEKNSHEPRELNNTDPSYSNKYIGQSPQTTSNNSLTSTGKHLAHYQRLKNVLRNSLRRSKDFVKSETKRLSSSFTCHTAYSSSSVKNSNHNQTDPQISSSSSTFDLDALFVLDEQAPVTQQLVQTVTICRQLPELEISPEMVEAERLLLFSKLRRDGGPSKMVVPRMREIDQQTYRFYLDSMRLEIRTDANKDLFFNYFYIVTFECDGVIKSTQSAECQNGEAVFSDCGIEFACGLAQEEVVINCNIFMLRLRKVSTLSLEPQRSILKRPKAITVGATSSSSSVDEISSRFRLHASFSISAHDLAPFEYVECESKNARRLCLRTSCTAQLPLITRTRSTNLAEIVEFTGRADLRFLKRKYSGYLNVQDPHTQHSWNRRWCTLDGLHLYIFEDENQLLEKPILSLDLHCNDQQTPLAAAPRELCARSRSFCLQCVLRKAGEEVATAAVFFAADTQSEFEAWLEHINAVLKFIKMWMN